ncbi:N-acetylglucosaminyl-diphospho-decaprenol L-rhamnosyltransferase [Nocardioides alpinus]|uniref:Glycosyltransferase family 2 protein n=1 Tax=Nocardioides alpinus TaxID=748909 RepID=A0A1I0W5I5_9ACTN|nr:glycosyltransferase [Nocardioides alpinus]PKH37658.1 glycosyltransferase family 2 protein [Nocardioides alpinus]SFA83136.1 N-acetylglucosaminyl-diphospho-decaprenol L-rhamnosyltransferase [Nocardioides alpinus]
MSTPSDRGGHVVSAVVAHYGDPAVAHQAVLDLLAQVGPHRIEIIVVDDCSPLPFPEIAGVTTIRRPRNGGFGAAVNTGAAAATGDLLMIVNSDIRTAPGFVERLLHEADPLMPAVVGPRTTTTTGEEEPTGRRFPTAAHWAVESVVLLQRFSLHPWYQRAIGRVRPHGSQPVRVDWLQGSLLLMPLDAFREVGGFDERFFLYSEEVDLQRRLGARDVHSWLLPSLEVRHVGGASTDAARSNEWLTRSRVTYAEKWGGLRTLRHSMRAVALVNLATRLVQRAAGRRTAPRLAWKREMAASRIRPWPLSRPDGHRS